MAALVKWRPSLDALRNQAVLRRLYARTTAAAMEFGGGAKRRGRRHASVAGAREVGGRAVVSGWKRRHRVGKAPPERALNSSRVTALERTLHEFPARSNGEVILPEVGVSFDSIGEAYDFYNLYSWERGFRVRYGKSRLNVDRVKVHAGDSMRLFGASAGHEFSLHPMPLPGTSPFAANEG
ncbi:uncharacterized protein [Lolium perenne]|uniref:uncharacterized protein n=1 Tax=Lolium perenne TaxID=4522 RepID=UPI003A98D636